MRVCLAHEHKAVPRPGLEPGPLDPESSALTIWPLHLPQAQQKHRLSSLLGSMCTYFVKPTDDKKQAV